MSRLQYGQCVVRHDDPQKRRNVKVVEERQDYVRMTQIEINQNERQHILEYYHNNIGHPRIQKTMELL